MQKACVIALLFIALPVMAQDAPLDLDVLMESAQQWATNNLDDNVARSIQDNVDSEKVRSFLSEAQKEFNSRYVVDLAQLRDTATLVLPILESRFETQPYAIWLRSRLDLLDVAKELRRNVPPSERGSNSPNQTLPNPQQMRGIWINRISKDSPPRAADPLIAKLKAIFAEEKVPTELVWIAEVESSFDSRAESPAGAVGLFQLMPATAKRFGLRTWPFDQRTDEERNARASAKYLRQLYAQFKDWRLAIAAYNAGEGTVQRLLNREKAKTYDAIADQLSAETQLYVPKVEAVILKREGVKLESLSP